MTKPTGEQGPGGIEHRQYTKAELDKLLNWIFDRPEPKLQAQTTGESTKNVEIDEGKLIAKSYRPARITKLSDMDERTRSFYENNEWRDALLETRKFDRPAIEIGDKIYRLSTNFTFYTPEDVANAADSSLDEYRQKRAIRNIAEGTNKAMFYGELVRRGFGIIPDGPAVDRSGQELGPNHHAFYHDTALPSYTWSHIHDEIDKMYPPKQNPFFGAYDAPLVTLTKPAIAEMFDTVLAQEKFAEALAHSQAHLASKTSSRQ